MPWIPASAGMTLLADVLRGPGEAPLYTCINTFKASRHMRTHRVPLARDLYLLNHRGLVKSN